jgi:hypothetical protein
MRAIRLDALLLGDHRLVEDLVGHVRLALEDMQPRLEEEGKDAVRVPFEVPPEDAGAHRNVDVRNWRRQRPTVGERAAREVQAGAFSSGPYLG